MDPRTVPTVSMQYLYCIDTFSTNRQLIRFIFLGINFSLSSVILRRIREQNRNKEMAMTGIPRRELIEPAEVGLYHCRRCGEQGLAVRATDPVTGRNFDQRKVWIQDG